MDYENTENDNYDHPNLSSESSSVSSNSNLLGNVPILPIVVQQAQDPDAEQPRPSTVTTTSTTTTTTTEIISNNTPNISINSSALQPSLVPSIDSNITTNTPAVSTNSSSAPVQFNASFLFDIQVASSTAAASSHPLRISGTTSTQQEHHSDIQNDTEIQANNSNVAPDPQHHQHQSQRTEQEQLEHVQQQHELHEQHSPTPTFHQTAPPPTPPQLQPQRPDADVVIEDDETEDDEHDHEEEVEQEEQRRQLQPVPPEIIDANAIADTIDAGAIDNEEVGEDPDEEESSNQAATAASGIEVRGQRLHSVAVLPSGSTVGFSVTRASLPQLLRAPRPVANNNDLGTTSASTSASTSADSTRRTRHFYSNNGSHFSNDMFSATQKSQQSSPKTSSRNRHQQRQHSQHQQSVDRLRMLYPNVNENETPLPRCWSSHDKCLSLGLSQNNLRVTYKGLGIKHSDAASVRTAYPIPSSCGLYYFEVRIISKGRNGYMGIGLTAQQFRMNRLPGWDKQSYGYHGDDGHSFHSSGNGTDYGPTFTTGDIIGCCLDFVNNSCFYTKNGVNLGVAFKDLPTKLYPTVGLQTPGEEVDANFGQEPFKFEKFEEMLKEMRANVLRKIDRYPHLLETPENLMSRLVSTYLVHSGYSKTAEAFNAYTQQPFDEDLSSIKTRQKIIKLIQTGKMSQAIEHTIRSYPGLLENNKNLWFALKCRQFIEMINGADVEHSNNKVTVTTQTMPTNQTSVIQSTKAFKHSKSNNTSQPQNNTAQLAVIKNSGKQQQQEMKNMIIDDNSNKCLEHDSNSMDVEMEPCNSHVNGDTCSNGNASAARNPLDAIDEEMDMSPSSRNYGRVIEKILEFGKELSTMGQQLEKDNLMTEEERQMLEDAFSLIAYSNPWSSPLGWLLCPSRRENVSTTLNSAILESLHFERRPPLEYLVAHAAELIKIIGQHSLGEDAFITIDDVFPQN
ncbi:ran-binding proteins 9/10 homolog isoform X2 [Scaptodrosophila lebanonensis]|uniref:Ran-binding proteins 9/10 homolog isoform X2 n=1 Tax=Drosophila lebanonensis TaxID=7225 RepID=A0A6J2TJU2_DROLE|nr:ran-binding proteins 9/10 homolog isoform X2 [Scaptodrosophila lebanonensis]